MAEMAETSLSFSAERVFGLLVLGAIIFACFWIARPLCGSRGVRCLPLRLLRYIGCSPAILEIAQRWQRRCSCSFLWHS